MTDGTTFEYKVVHGKPDAVEKQLNELAPQGWEVIGIASAADGGGSFVIFFSRATVTVVLRRERGRP